MQNTNIETKIDKEEDIDITTIKKDKIIITFISSFIISSGLFYFGVYLVNL